MKAIPASNGWCRSMRVPSLFKHSDTRRAFGEFPAFGLRSADLEFLVGRYAGSRKTHASYDEQEFHASRYAFGANAINIGRRSPAFPVTPPGVRVRTGRFGRLSYRPPVNLGIPSESK